MLDGFGSVTPEVRAHSRIEQLCCTVMTTYRTDLYKHPGALPILVGEQHGHCTTLLHIAESVVLWRLLSS